MIDDSEKEDFISELEAHGFDPSDFSIAEIDQSNVQEGVYRLVGTATVTRKSATISRSYPTGHATSWVADFSDDLVKGLFGKA